jgi:hypothetical protein
MCLIGNRQRAVGFFWTYRQIYPVSRQVLRDIATQYHNWANVKFNLARPG